LAAIGRSLYSKLNNGEPGVAATFHVAVLDGPGISHSNRHTAQYGSDATNGANVKPVGVPNIERTRGEQLPAK